MLGAKQEIWSNYKPITHIMKKLFGIAVLIVIGGSSISFAQKSNIELGVDGQIGQVYFRSISGSYRETILAQLVSDDVIKKAKFMAEVGNYIDAYQLFSSGHLE